jgi:threonine efflux protein
VLVLLPVLGVWLLAVLSPGPDFLVIVQYATSRSRRHGIVAGLGVISAMTVWATGSLVGLSVLFARLSWLYDMVRLAGAAYLIYLGLRMLLAKSSHGASPAVRQPGNRLWRAWRDGFLTNLGNPKAAAFFGSLLGALMPAHAGVGLKVAVVPLIVGMAAGWYTIVATLFGLAPVARVYRRARRWIDRVMAALLIALGGRLAVDR